VLYDTRARDTTEYGNTSALVRFYYVNVQSGNRFPVSLGVGTFGGNSPLDVSAGRGGFALSGLLDLVGLTQLRELGIVKSVNAGLECALFIPIARKSRVLIDVQVGFSL
jgi:hypothetical protein